MSSTNALRESLPTVAEFMAAFQRTLNKGTAHTTAPGTEITDGTPVPQSKEESPGGSSWYQEGGIEPIDYIESNRLCFAAGSIVKYVTRAGKKPFAIDIEKTPAESAIIDLEKVKWYADRLIAQYKQKI